MKKSLFIISMLLLALASSSQDSIAKHWKINPSGGISWEVQDQESHNDHIEMAGLRVATVLRYGVDKSGSFKLNRGMVWPLLRTIPNNTHASLMRRFEWNIIDMLLVNGRSPENEKVQEITLDGLMRVRSVFSFPHNGQMELKRVLFPSVAKPAFCEHYTLKNIGTNTLTVEIPDAKSRIKTQANKGVSGEYSIVSEIKGQQSIDLKAGEIVSFYAYFAAYKPQEKEMRIDVAQEQEEREALIASYWSKLILETPDPSINAMFAFAKIRATESIYQTQGGLMHGPGGESYYAAIWANDQAEYVNPFFPFLGNKLADESALNSFQHFARFMNDQYKPIPSSIIAEGLDIWNGAGDRGDAAMIAYGAARYALAKGSKIEAQELWPLIEWCLEFCRRNINQGAVVASDSDELEGRFPAGKANLCTSSLYYDALHSAIYLGKDLGKPATQLASYSKQAKEIRSAIELYFGGNVEGFETYKYYEGNNILRSWICMPLSVGIDERKQGTIDALFSPRLWSQNGFLTQAGSETFWDRSTLYALRGIYTCGETEKATEYLKYYSQLRLLGEHVPYAVEAWPEGEQRHLSAESGLYCRIITEGLFGIRPSGLKSFILSPRLPKDWNNMALRKIQAFGKEFDIELTRKNEGEIEVLVSIPGKIVVRKAIKEGKQILVNL